MVKVIHNDATIDWDTSVVYYDKYNRVIQSISGNHMGGTDIISNQYNFAGELLKTVQLHRLPGKDNIKLTYYYEYDQQGRLLQTRQKVNSDSVLVNKLEYNELGQVI